MDNTGMVIAVCVIKLQMSGVYSLKDKRRVLKSILARLPQNFKLTAAEIDHHEVWSTAVIGLVTIGTDSGYLHGRLEKAVAWLEQNRPDAPIEDYYIEFR